MSDAVDAEGRENLSSEGRKDGCRERKRRED